MQYLYTLTSTVNDLYYEQFLLSAASLKQQMPNANITLLCDSDTKKTLVGKRSEYEKLVWKTIATDTPEDLSQIEVSRWVRTSMRRLVQGEFLFLDGDTIVTDDLSSITEMNINFGACLDKHSLINNHFKKNDIIKRDKKLKFDSHLSGRHFNGGVLFCADTPDVHKIFDRWHELWLFGRSKNILRDQPSLNAAIHENLPFFTELDGTWNCQVAFNGLPFLERAKIIHYFISDTFLTASPYIFSSENLLRQIKEAGTITNDALELLKKPKSAFFAETQILSGSEMLSVINSDLFQSIIFLRKKLPSVFKLFNFFCSLLKKIVKNIIIKSSKKKGTSIYN